MTVIKEAVRLTRKIIIYFRVLSFIRFFRFRAMWKERKEKKFHEMSIVAMELGDYAKAAAMICQPSMSERDSSKVRTYVARASSIFSFADGERKGEK